MSARRRRAGRIAAAALVLAAPVALTGCSDLGGTGDQNFVTGDGTIVAIPASEREAPVEASGTSLQQEPIDVADYRGQVVVINFWGSWCNPCRDEAPTLQTASQELDAVFLGAQLRPDSTDAALAFEREFGITYPTIADQGATLLALGRYAPRASPGTAILDREGRVAAVINGPITSVVTLADLVEDVAGDGSSGDSSDGASGSPSEGASS
ncbi:TlpA family protein disulfide reductase [Nocardioides sp.]|uniref:TlpA family protein disulfide reductase n=1 Tax=Nocardioides sp. TaxID=35761 RepID=UPI00351392E6